MKLGLMAPAVQGMLEMKCISGEHDLSRLFQATADLGARCIELGVRGDRSEFVDRVGDLKHRYGFGVELGYGPIVYDGSDLTRAAENFSSFIEEVCLPLEVTRIGAVSPFHGGRWLHDPPLEHQLDKLVEGLHVLAPVAHRYEVYIAIENHADYRGVELAGLIERVGCSSLGVKFDTGNVYCVIEDPITAAKAVAKHTVMTHLKDIIVEAEPCNRGLPGGLLALTECALGDGHVDIPAIVAMLADEGPLGHDLVLTIECPPAWVERSMIYAKEVLAACLD